jgi:hypothetical protein
MGSYASHLYDKNVGLTEEVARLRATLAQRTAERDEARRIACSAYAAKGRDLATERGWECFSEEVQP